MIQRLHLFNPEGPDHQTVWVNYPTRIQEGRRIVVDRGLGIAWGVKETYAPKKPVNPHLVDTFVLGIY